MGTHALRLLLLCGGAAAVGVTGAASESRPVLASLTAEARSPAAPKTAAMPPAKLPASSHTTKTQPVKTRSERRPAPAAAPRSNSPPGASGAPPATTASKKKLSLTRTGFGWLILQMILILLLVCAVAYALLRWGLRRFQGTLQVPSGMRIVTRLGLEPRRSLFLVEVGNRYFLIGTSEQGLNLLSEVDRETASDIERNAPGPTKKRSFREVFLGSKRK